MSQAYQGILREKTDRLLIIDHSERHVCGKRCREGNGKIPDSDLEQSENLGQDLFVLHDWSSAGGTCTQKADHNHRVWGWGRFAPNHRIIIRRATESHTNLTQDGASSGFRRWSLLLLGALGFFLVQWVYCLPMLERNAGLFLGVSRHVSPAVSVSPEEKPRQDYCVTKGEIGLGICSSQCIFGKHISIFNLHQI